MQKLLLLVAAGLVAITSFAQSKKTTYSAGALISRPAYFPNTESNDATGIGFEIQREQLFSKKFSWTASAGYIHFSGTHKFIDYSNIPRDTSISGYANIPVFAGLRYYFWRKLFLGGEAGAMIQASKNTGTLFSLAPSLGYKFNVAHKHAIDASVRLINTLPGYGTLEANSLSKGGYGIWVLKAAYAF